MATNAIANGAVLTYQGTWDNTTFYYQGADAVVAAVLSVLEGRGLVSRGFTVSARDVLSTTFNVALTLQVENGIGFNQIVNVTSLINDAVYQVTGKYPISNSVPTIGGSPTGQPGNSNTGLDDQIKAWATIGVVGLLIYAGAMLYFASKGAH